MAVKKNSSNKNASHLTVSTLRGFRFRRMLFPVGLVFALLAAVSGIGQTLDQARLVWYRFDEAAGTIANDSSGNNNDG